MHKIKQWLIYMIAFLSWILKEQLNLIYTVGGKIIAKFWFNFFPFKGY